ncbi:MAG: tyrosine--tRNA ligase [Nanoarchaeota archaeon]
MDEKRFNLVKEVGEEINTEADLKKLVSEDRTLVAYDGFEPSGSIHIAQAVLRAINVNKMIKAGCRFKMFVADWHAWANNKMGGDLEKIQTVGKYFMEVWKASGMDLENVDFVWASELVKDEDYWKIVMKVAINSTVNRIIRCSQIMGRDEKESLSAAQILYPCMQAADIFYLKADICQLGMDQRKVNMLAREVGEKIGYYKPVVVSHHMLMGLQQPSTEKEGVEKSIEMKMSKSKPDTAIFVTDAPEEVERKMKKAYCPEGQAEENPILEYCKYIIFEKINEFVIERPEKFGGTIKFNTYEELEKAFVEKKVHPMDLKAASAKYINQILEPIHKHFNENAEAKKLLETVQGYQVTR